MANFSNKNVPYTSFFKPPKQDWVKKILSELKADSYEQLKKRLEPDLFVEPAYHNNDTTERFLISPYKQWKKYAFIDSTFPLKKTSFLLDELEAEAIFQDLRFEKNSNYKILLKTNYEEKIYEDAFSASFFLENSSSSRQNIFFADLFAEAGLTSAQQLAIIIFAVKSLNVPVILWTTDDYFLISIAKLLAFHKYFQEKQISKPELWVRSSLNSLTRKLPHTNLIRVSIASFAAAVSGVDAILPLPFNLHSQIDENSLRLAVNTLNILDYEAGLRSIENPLAGTYSLEILSDAIKKQAETYLQTLIPKPQETLNTWIAEGLKRLKERSSVKIGANKYQIEERVPTQYKFYYSNIRDLIPYGILVENIS